MIAVSYLVRRGGGATIFPLDDGKQRVAETLQTGTGAATEGTGRAAAAGGRNAAGDLAGTLRDVRQARLQVRSWRAAWSALVSERNPGKRSHGRGSDRCRAGRARPPLDRELSSDQGTSGKDFRDQSRTAAAGAPAKEKIAGRRRTTWSTIIPNFGLDFSILLR